TILVDRIDELVPAIRRLTAALQAHFAARVSANTYLSFRRGSALAAHFDDHDIIVAQIHGAKRWGFYDRREAFPVAIDRPARSGAPAPTVPVR
ncbi:cupin domain-containing protein, partial [Acinetobacter baumannii]